MEMIVNMSDAKEKCGLLNALRLLRGKYRIDVVQIGIIVPDPDVYHEKADAIRAEERAMTER